MNVLKEGKAHKELVVYFACNFCGSELRAICGDPRVKMECMSVCGSKYYRVKTICPVCKMKVDEETHKFNADETLTLQDKEEMKTWEDDKLEDLSEDDLVQNDSI